MKRQINLWQLMGFAFTSLGGTILHFLFDWLGGSLWVAPFAAVNESTWEHMKLIFLPMLIFAAVQGVFFKDRHDFWCVKLRGILTGLILIPVLFYTYNGVIGTSPDWVNIVIFFISAASAYLYETALFKKDDACRTHPRVCVIILLIIGVLFVVFTFFTPSLSIFKDPLTQAYGLRAI